MNQLYDFNKANQELIKVTLEGLSALPGRFFIAARNKHTSYAIAEKFGISPREVFEWDPEEVMEALAYMKLTEPKTKGGK